MSAGSQIDLSALPAPDLIEPLSFEAILTAMKADFATRYPGYDVAALESDPVVKVLETAAYRELLLRQRVNDCAQQVMLAYATGTNLDHLGAFLDTPRLIVTPADPTALPPVDEVYETDAAYRRRIQLAFEAATVAGSLGAYTYHALSAHGRIKDVGVAAHTPKRGDVTVAVLSHDGDGSPSAEVLAAVAAALTPDEVRPVNDTVVVRPATVLHYTVEAVLKIGAGPDASVLRSAALAAATTYVATCHACGRIVARSGLDAALHQSGVLTVDLIAPSTDIVPDALSAAYCTDLSVSVEVVT